MASKFLAGVAELAAALKSLEVLKER